MIDFSFIAELEGYSNIGYVPDAENSQSGVTIASGFDIGQRRKAELESAFSPEVSSKLIPYAGKTGAAAQLALEQQPLTLTDIETEIINRFAHREAEARLRFHWKVAQTYCAFDQLPDVCQTIVASVAFQYGYLPTRTPNFWKQVTQGDWHAALENLLNFGDRYPSRRHQEANLLQRHLTTIATTTQHQ